MSRTPMKLILPQEGSGLGAPGDVVAVAAGYGANYLIPRGFAMRWTRGAEKQVDLIRRARSVREIRSLDDAKSAASPLQSPTLRSDPARIRHAVDPRGREAGRSDPAGPLGPRDPQPGRRQERGFAAPEPHR